MRSTAALSAKALLPKDLQTVCTKLGIQITVIVAGGR